MSDRWHLTREELDEFSANSQQKAEKAMAEHKFDDEIVPVQLKLKNKSLNSKWMKDLVQEQRLKHWQNYVAAG